MKDGKPTGGYDRLKIKYNMLLETHKEEIEKGRELVSRLKKENEVDNATIERQDHKIEELQKTIEKQQTRISELIAELARADAKYEESVKQIDAIIDEMMRYMGPISRWFFYLNHKDGIL